MVITFSKHSTSVSRTVYYVMHIHNFKPQVNEYRLLLYNVNCRHACKVIINTSVSYQDQAIALASENPRTIRRPQRVKLSGMASGSHYFTASEVCDIVTAGEEDDPEYIFPGSDDDFDMSELDEGYDPLQREQGNVT